MVCMIMYVYDCKLKPDEWIPMFFDGFVRKHVNICIHIVFCRLCQILHELRMFSAGYVKKNDMNSWVVVIVIRQDQIVMKQALLPFKRLVVVGLALGLPMVVMWCSYKSLMGFLGTPPNPPPPEPWKSSLPARCFVGLPHTRTKKRHFRSKTCT